MEQQIQELLQRITTLEDTMRRSSENSSITYRTYDWTDKLKALAFPALFGLVVFFFSVTYNQLQKTLTNQDDIKVQLMVQGEKFNGVQLQMNAQSRIIDDLNERMKAVERAVNK